MIAPPTRSRRIKAAVHAARIASAADDLDRRLEQRRQDRAAKAMRARKGALTRSRRAFEQDVLRNSLVAF